MRRPGSIKVMIYLALYLKHPAMKKHRELEAKLHIFLTTPVSRFDHSTIALSVTVLGEQEDFRVNFDLIATKKFYSMVEFAILLPSPWIIVLSTKL